MEDDVEIGLKKIAEAAELFGWEIAIPSTDEQVTGIIIGTSEYIDDVLAGKYANKEIEDV